MKTTILAVWVWMWVGLCGVRAAETGKLNEHLEPFRAWLGKTYRGEFKNSTPEKPVVDVSRWERAMNGQAVRVLHSINGGEYGGETLIFWSAEKKSLAYVYVTTAGFQTEGTMTHENGRFTSLEKVKGNAGGISEVRAVSHFKADGTLQVESEYLKEGKWEKGRSTLYREDPKAEVVFR